MTHRISELSIKELHNILRTRGLYLKVGPFGYRIRSCVEQIAEGIHNLYGFHRYYPSFDFVDFDIRIDSPSAIRRWIRPKLDFSLDGGTPFKPLPLKHAFAFLEWGMNWCVAGSMNQYLKLHAAVLEKNGRALVMPGAPGAGKSTLCAALSLRGWRLLSDEHALVSLDDATLVPVCRPISLKNQSIDVIKKFDGSVVFGPICEDTHKGVVVHMKPDARSVSQDAVVARPGWLIFPTYKADSNTRLEERIKETAFLKAADQSFNYSMLAETGFDVMSKLIDQSECFNFTYSSLDEAVEVFEQLGAGS